MAETTEQLLISIDVDAEAAVKASGEQINAIAKLREETAKLKDEQKKARQEGKDNEQAYTKNAEQIARNEAQIKNLSTALNNNQKIVKAITNETTGTTGAYQRLNEEYQVAAQRAKDLAVAYGVNSKEALSATNAAKVMSDRLKQVDESVGQNQRNVGNYSSVLQKLPGGFGSVAEGAQGVGNAFKLLSTNPLMAILQLLLPLIISLSSQFKAFAPVMDVIEQVTAAVGAAFSSLVNSIIAVFNGTKSLGDFFKSFAGDMSDAATETKNLTKAQQDLDDAIRINSVNQAKYKNQIDELILQSKNRTLSEKERIALIDQALKLEQKAYNERRANANTELKLIQDEISAKLNLTAYEISRLKRDGVAYALWLQNKKQLSDELVDKLKDAQIEQARIDNESIQLREKALNRQEVLQQKADENAEKNRTKKDEKIKKERENSIKSAEADIKMMQQSTNKMTELSYVEILRKQKELIQQQVEWNLLTQEEANLRRLEAENNYHDALIKLTKEKYAEQEQAMRDLMNIKLSINEEDTNLSIEALLLDNQNRLLLQQQSIDGEYALRKADLDRRRQEEINAANAIGADTSLINERYRQEDLEMQRIQTMAKMDIASSLLGSLSDIFGKGTAAGKAAASAQIAVDSISGAFAAFTGMTKAIPGPIGLAAGAVAAAGVVAKGVRAIGDVWKVKENQKSVSTSVQSAVNTGATRTGQSVSNSVALNQPSVNQSSQIVSGIGKAMQSVSVQPVLVVDDVTTAMNRKVSIKDTNSI